MLFNKHSELTGKHAVMSASNNAWVRYEPDKFDRWFGEGQAAMRGTMLHEYARLAIVLGTRQPDDGSTISTYINDAIDYKMTPEQVLYVSPQCFGTADAIAYRRKRLRIHDLKNGLIKTGEKQLYMYSAFFCIEYGLDPRVDIDEIELRIYQNNDVRIHKADPEEIYFLMNEIKARVARWNELQAML